MEIQSYFKNIWTKQFIPRIIELEFLKTGIDYDNSKEYFKYSYFYFCSTHIFA